MGPPYLTRHVLQPDRRDHGATRSCWCLPSAAAAIAGALNFIGADTLYGRYWGALEDHPFLHFEVCYYQAIEFAIAHELARVEAGAQGAHKLARGYLPSQTYQRPLDRRSRPAPRRRRLPQARAPAVAREIALLSEESPFKRA